MFEILITAAITAVVNSVWEHWLGNTKKIDANTTVELITGAVKKRLKKSKG